MRDIYDHLIRISDLVDGYRDLLSGVMDTHLSTVSNRLNVVMKQLTIIATVFLPLSFLTGFFGQNFSWLVGHITGWVAVHRLRHRPRSWCRPRALLYLFRKRGLAGRAHRLTGPGPAAGRRAMTAARAERNDMTETTEAHERIEPSPRKLPIEPTDSAEPTDPRIRSPPIRCDRIEPAELIERIESVELIDQQRPPVRTSIPTVWPGPGPPVCSARPSLPGAAPAARPVTVVSTALPAASTTYQRPPALVRPWPVALPGVRSAARGRAASRCR